MILPRPHTMFYDPTTILTRSLPRSGYDFLHDLPSRSLSSSLTSQSHNLLRSVVTPDLSRSSLRSRAFTILTRYPTYDLALPAPAMSRCLQCVRSGAGDGGARNGRVRQSALLAWSRRVQSERCVVLVVCVQTTFKRLSVR